MEDRIEKWLGSEFTTLALDVKPLSEYIDVMERLGYETGEFDSNGWQVDFWLTFKKDNEKDVTIAGSLWYGDYSLSK